MSCSNRQDQQRQSNAADGSTANLQARVEELSQRVNELSEQLDEQSDWFDGLRQEVSETAPVEVKVLEEGFSVARTRFGTLLILCRGVTPYLNGQKVKLWIGNPLIASVSGVSMTCKYGIACPRGAERERPKGMEVLDWIKKREKWRRSLHSTTAKVSKDLAPGAWTEVELVLAPCNSDELGWFELRPDCDDASICLRPPQAK
jgi:hypothetical protein